MKNVIFNVLKKLISPISNQFPFLISFFILISVSSFKFLIAGILNGNVDGIVYVHFSRAMAISYLLSCVLYLTQSKLLKVLFYVVGVSLFSLTIFLWIVFHLIIQPQIVTFIGETNTTEATEFLNTFLLSWKGILCLLLIAIIVLLIVLCEHYWYKKYKTLIRRKAFKCFEVILFMVSFFGFFNFDIYYRIAKSKSTDDLYLGDPLPYDAVTSSIFSLNSIRTTKHEMKEAVNVSLKSSKGYISEKDSLNVILVIGESYIKYHSQIYGYYLPTTPFLNEEKKMGNLFVFNNVISAFNGTSQTLRNMLCCNSLKDNEKWYETPFFPVLFKKSGFNVSYWDIQLNDDSQTTDAFTLKSFLFNKELAKATYSDQSYKAFKYDDDLISDYASSKKHHGKYNLAIFHLWGQHVDASKRFPHIKKYVRFSYKDIKNNKPFLNNSKRQEIADYDNATYYNDCVLKHIISLFRYGNSVIVYFSDHGEEIYDYRDSKGRAGCGSDVRNFYKYQYDIPFMIWCSDSYIKKHPAIVKQIRLSVNKPFMTDIVCHLLFHLGNLRTKYYNQERDVLSNKYLIRDRVLGNGTDYDKIMK